LLDEFHIKIQVIDEVNNIQILNNHLRFLSFHHSISRKMSIPINKYLNMRTIRTLIICVINLCHTQRGRLHFEGW